MTPRLLVSSQRLQLAWTSSVYSPLSFLLPIKSREPQQREAHILASLSDNPSAYNKKIRRGRGPASGKGKTSGRGHKGQKQHGKVPAFFNGGQTPDIVVHGERGYKNIFSLDMATVNLDRIQEWIDQGRIDPKHPITVRELAQSRCVHQTKDGIKLLARGGDNVLKQPIHVVVSRASVTAIAAVEAVGGSVTTRFYTRSSIQRILRGQTHPYLSTAWSEHSGPALLNQGLLELGKTATTSAISGVADLVSSQIGGALTEIHVMKTKGYTYRLPDPSNRKDIEYYRDPAHRGYLSHLVGPKEGPSLFFLSPAERKSTAGVKKEKVLPENRLW